MSAAGIVILILIILLAIETLILVYIFKRPLKKKKVLEAERESLLNDYNENLDKITKIENKRKKLKEKAKKIDNPKDAFKFMKTIKRNV